MKIGLALSGGGALGMAHIGAIEELEKANIKIDCVCGVSAGAIIGLLYAAGGKELLSRFYDEIANFDYYKKDKILFSARPAVVFRHVWSLLKKLSADKEFGQLKIPFSCCATNLASGECEVFNSGDPIASVMASAAYPGVFASVKINGKSYIDGGVTCNLPGQQTRKMGANFIVGSSIYSVNELTDGSASKINRLGITLRALNIFEKELSKAGEKQCDFCFKPHVEHFNWYDFFHINEIIKEGRANAARQIVSLKSLLTNTNCAGRC